MKKIIALLIMVLMICSSISTAFALSPAYVSDVCITGSPEITMYVGDTITLEAIATPEGVDHAFISWEADKENIVEIEASSGETLLNPPVSAAKITALTTGEVVVTAYADVMMGAGEYSEASDSVKITVVDRNECEELYNISYYTFAVNYDDDITGKITSVQELTDVFSNDEEILSKYDEDFFNDKFLYVVGCTMADTSYDVRVTSVSNTEDSISIEVTGIKARATGDMVLVPWTVILEMDKSLADKNISSNLKNQDLTALANISYYGGISMLDSTGWEYWEDTVLPEQRRKIIKSAAELTNFIDSAAYLPTSDEDYQEVISTYDNDFFESKFLLFVNWKYCDGSTLSFDVSNICDNGGLIAIEAVENKAFDNETVIDEECDWLIVFEMDSSLLDKDFAITMQTERGNEVEIISYSPSDFVPPMSVEDKYNISYYEDIYYISESTEGKITSYEELEAIFPNNGFILSMYDEAFFEDKFLYRIGYDAPDPSYDVKVSSVAESQDSVSIEVTVTDNEAIVPDVEVPWVIFLEFDKSYLDKDISSNLKRPALEDLAKISYYGRMAITDTKFHGRDNSEPHRRKVIKSVAELEKYVASMPRNPIPDARFNNVISAYDEEFFKDNFLVFVAWMYPMGGDINYSISEVRDDNGVVNIKALETNMTPPGHMTTQAEENWTILFEINSSVLESGFSLAMTTGADTEVDIITYIPSQFRTVTPEAVYGNAFGEEGTVLAEISLGADNAQKTVMVGSTELYYSVERDKHIGVIDPQYVVDNKITSVSVIDKSPVIITYGDVNDFSYQGTVTNGDLYELKMYMQGSSSLNDKTLIMADVTGDGKINNGDVLQLKLYLQYDKAFSVLGK